METIDPAEVVADEPKVTRIPDAQVARQQAQTERPGPSSNDQIVEAHEPGSMFSLMSEKLDAAMKELLKPGKEEPVKETPPKELKKAEVKPEVKPDAKTTDKPVEDDKTFTSAKAADWKKLKDTIKERETKLAEWEAKFAAKEKEASEMALKFQAEDKTPIYEKQIADIKAKHDALAEEMQKVALERFEPFVSAFNKRFSDAITDAKDAVGTEHAELIEQLLSVPPSKWRKEQINTIREELIGADQGKLDIAIHEMDKARTEKEQQLKDSKTNLERAQGMLSQRQQREQELAKARTDATINKVINMARNYEAFKIGEDPEHNLLVKGNEDSVARFFRMELAPEEIAIMPIVAAEGKRLMEKVLPALQKENAELKEALKAHQVAKPSLEGGKEGKDTSKPKTFAEAFQEHWPGQG